MCREDCKKEGGDLASIHSLEENDFIASFIGEHLMWIAGSITEMDGDFSWTDGSDWDFEYWDISVIFHEITTFKFKFIFSRRARQKELC